MIEPGLHDPQFMRAAYEQALKSYHEGGLPIGAVMVENGTIVAAGHNRRVQDGDPIAHGEMDCFRRAWANMPPNSTRSFGAIGTMTSTGGHHAVIDYLYECLSIPDSKCSSLLSFSSIVSKTSTPTSAH